jgi:hypothetical protein
LNKKIAFKVVADHFATAESLQSRSSRETKITKFQAYSMLQHNNKNCGVWKIGDRTSAAGTATRDIGNALSMIGLRPCAVPHGRVFGTRRRVGGCSDRGIAEAGLRR